MDRTTEHNSQLEERISRTAENVYQKGDAATWMIVPKNRTPFWFVDVNELSFFEEEDDTDLEDFDLQEFIEHTQALVASL